MEFEKRQERERICLTMLADREHPTLHMSQRKSSYGRETNGETFAKEWCWSHLQLKYTVRELRIVVSKLEAHHLVNPSTITKIQPLLTFLSRFTVHIKPYILSVQSLQEMAFNKPMAWLNCRHVLLNDMKRFTTSYGYYRRNITQNWLTISQRRTQKTILAFLENCWKWTNFDMSYDYNYN